MSKVKFSQKHAPTDFPNEFVPLTAQQVVALVNHLDELARLGVELAQNVDMLLSDSDVRYAISEAGEEAPMHRLTRQAREILRVKGGK